MNRRPRVPPRISIPIVLLIVYAVAVTVRSMNCLDQINPDGVSYLRLAGYLADGKPSLSVTGHWSPLIVWCLAPFLALGVEDLIAARIVMALAGALVLVGVWLLSGRVGLRLPLRTLATIAAGALIVDWATLMLTPDLLLTGIILLYLSVLTSPSTWQDARPAAVAGALGGLAYLAKAYAFPYFLLHFPVMLWLRPGLAAGSPPQRRLGCRLRAILLPWSVGLLAFAAVCAGWIACLSSMHGSLLISSVGDDAVRYTIQQQYGRERTVFDGLVTPPAHAISQWEDPRSPDFTDPEEHLSAASRLRLLLKAVVMNLEIYTNRPELPFRLAPLFVLAVAVMLGKDWFGSPSLARMLLATIVIYSSGYLMVLAQTRYLQPVILLDLLLVYLLFQRSLREARMPGAPRGAVLLLTALALLPLAWTMAFASKRVQMIPHPGQDVAAVAQEIRRLGGTGPLASTNWERGICVAYRLGIPFPGKPYARSAAEVEKELRSARIGTFLVWGDPVLALDLRPSRDWKLSAYLDPSTSPALEDPVAIFLARDPSGGDPPEVAPGAADASATSASLDTGVPITAR